MTTFKIDQQAVRALTRRDRGAEAETAALHGFYDYYEYKVVPLAKIKPEKVWRDAKLQAVQRDIAKGRPLAPIRVTKKGSRYEIEDGIHRYNASVLDPQITHIPIVEHITVSAPELRVQVQDTPKLKPGTWVKLHDPRKHGLEEPWAVVLEHLTDRIVGGATRHRYALAGFMDGSPDMLAGDFNDDQFDVVPRAPNNFRDQMQQEFDDYGMTVRVAARYLEAGKVTSDWLGLVRKTWKAKTRIPNISDAFDGTQFLQEVVDFIDQMAEDILFHRGFYHLPQEGSDSIPRRLKKKVVEELRATREILVDARQVIKSSAKSMDPESREYRMEGGFTYQFYQKQDPRSPLRAFNKGVRSRVQEAIKKADSVFSRKMLGAFTRYMNKYNQEEIDFGQIDLQFSVGNMKVVYLDFPTSPSGGPLSTVPAEAEGHRFPQPQSYLKHIQTAQALLKRKKLDFLWYGLIKIKCKSCGGENPYGSQFGVGAHYMTRGDFIQIYSDPSRGLAHLIIHELGHRYYYRFMSQADRAKFDDYFVGTPVNKAIEVLDKYQDILSDEHKREYLYAVGLANRPTDVQFLIRTYFRQFAPQDQDILRGWLDGVPATSEYGAMISSEDFAEVFADYVLDKDLSRDQVERLKAFLGRTRRTAAQLPHSTGGEPWQKVRLPGRGLLWTEPHDSEDAFPGAIASYEVVDGWLVYKGRNGSEGIVVGTASELQKWQRDVDNILGVAPVQAGPHEWTPEDGGERFVQQAVKAAQKVLRALGASARIKILVDSKNEPHGEAAGNELKLVNVHLGPGRGRRYIGGVTLPQHLQVATHEAAHLGYSRGGRKVLEALREHVQSGGDYLTMYHSLAGDFEGVMEAAAFYALKPKAFQKVAPEVFDATREWFGR